MNRRIQRRELFEQRKRRQRLAFAFGMGLLAGTFSAIVLNLIIGWVLS